MVGEGRMYEHRQSMHRPNRPRKLVDALNAIVPFEQQDPDEQFYPTRCGHGNHHWHENADAEGDTCNCGEWYRFADRIEQTEQ
jgi:hypothetical protein